MDYWAETIAEAFEDAGITATEDQIQTVAGWAEGAHENYGMAHGYDAIPNHESTEIARLKKAHENELEEMRQQVDCYRKSVAVRRGVKMEDVYLDNQGHVMYGKP